MSSTTHALAAATLSLATLAAVAFGLGDAEAVTAPQVSRVEILVPALVVADVAPPAAVVPPEVGDDLTPCLEATPGWSELVVWVEVSADGHVAGLTPGSTEELPEAAASCLLDVVGQAGSRPDQRSASVVLLR